MAESQDPSLSLTSGSSMFGHHANAHIIQIQDLALLHDIQIVTFCANARVTQSG